jgi:UDP-N-acetylmuramyl pentapeptide phosphotransferase/UDP-N-acetylglucosamine-1-phosphate transferase
MFLKYINFLLSKEILLISSLIISSTITFFSIPPIIYVSFKKKLVQKPTDRCSHTKKTPVFGGIGIFIGLIITTSLISCFLIGKNLNPFFISMFILFIMGIKDDIHILSADKKILGQIIASLIVILFSDIRINNFFGAFGIHQLDYYSSVLISLFTYVIIINCFNIIDGIDGLAGSIGIIFSLIIGIFFYILGEPIYTIISFSLLGSLLSFLYYNLSSKKKIFMGDTGSMVVGFLIAYLSIVIFSFDRTPPVDALNLPIVLLSLLLFPLLDALRIIIVRIFLLKKNPFKADSNHIHHKLIKLGLKHWEATFIITSITLTILLVSCCTLNNLEINLQIIVTAIIGIFLFSVPFIVNYLYENKIAKQNKFANETPN